MEINLQYITDANGTPLSVILPVNKYNELLKIAELYDDLEDTLLYYESKEDNSPAEPMEIVFNRIEKKRNNGRNTSEI